MTRYLMYKTQLQKTLRKCLQIDLFRQNLFSISSNEKKNTVDFCRLDSKMCRLLVGKIIQFILYGHLAQDCVSMTPKNLIKRFPTSK